MAVHDVAVQPVCAGGLRAAHLVVQPPEIAGEQGRSDDEWMHWKSVEI